MRRIERLKRAARLVAVHRGHKLGRFKTISSRRMTAECACGATVTVDPRPPPNGADVVGDAVAVNHETRIYPGPKDKEVRAAQVKWIDND